MKSILNQNEIKHEQPPWLGGTLVLSMAGAAMLFGFGMTFVMAKRRDPTFFLQSMFPARPQSVLNQMNSHQDSMESPSRLALRALGVGTLAAIAGTTCVVGLTWLMAGAPKSWTQFNKWAHSCALCTRASSSQ